MVQAGVRDCGTARANMTWFVKAGQTQMNTGADERFYADLAQVPEDASSVFTE